MELSDLRTEVYRDLAEATIGNERVPTQTLTVALNRSYVWLVSITKAFIREADVHAIAGQYIYRMHPDMQDIVSTRYNNGTTPLTATSRKELTARHPGFRDATPGTPYWYYMHDMSQRFGIYPPSVRTGDHINVEATVIPVEPKNALYTMGFKNTSEEIKVGAALVGETSEAEAVVWDVHLEEPGAPDPWVGGIGHLQVYRHTGTFEANETVLWGLADLFVVDPVPSLLPDVRLFLSADADTPPLPEAFQFILVHDAVARLCSRFLNDGGPTILQKIQTSLADRDALVRDMLGYEATGVGRPVSIARAAAPPQ